VIVDDEGGTVILYGPGRLAYSRLVAASNPPRLVFGEQFGGPASAAFLYLRNKVLSDVLHEVLDGRDDLTPAILTRCWVAAIVDDPAQLPGPGSGRLERQPGRAANSDEALATVNMIQENESVRAVRVDAHA
jgi:hypothetical protein